jgi:hypothetical protein
MSKPRPLIRKDKSMTLIEIINAKNALKNYFDKVTSGVTTCKIIKFIKFAEGQEIYFNEVKMQLLAKYGERDADGKFIAVEGGRGYKIRPDAAYAFLTASLELQNTEVEFAPALTLEELSPLEIKMGDMYAIFPIIKDA